MNASSILVSGAILLTTCMLSEAEVYKCKDPKGRVIYSDGPCDANAEKVLITPSNFGGAGQRDSDFRGGRPISGVPVPAVQGAKLDPKIQQELKGLEERESVLVAALQNGVALRDGSIGGDIALKLTRLATDMELQSIHERRSAWLRRPNPKIQGRLQGLDQQEADIVARIQSSTSAFDGSLGQQVELKALRSTAALQLKALQGQRRALMEQQ